MNKSVLLMLAVGLAALLSACQMGDTRLTNPYYVYVVAPGSDVHEFRATGQVGETFRVQNILHVRNVTRDRMDRVVATTQSEWTISSEGVVEWEERDGRHRHYRYLRAVAPGQAQVCAEYGRHHGCVRITVRR